MWHRIQNGRRRVDELRLGQNGSKRGQRLAHTQPLLFTWDPSRERHDENDESCARMCGGPTSVTFGGSVDSWRLRRPIVTRRQARDGMGCRRNPIGSRFMRPYPQFPTPSVFHTI